MSNFYLYVSAGNGPRECTWAAQRLAVVFSCEAKAAGLSGTVLTSEAEARSFLLRISGKEAKTFARARLGTIRWIGQSPFRKNHKRKNWYVSVSEAPTIADVPELFERDISFQSMKASGPGGQHVNATESAVRATHLPTGFSVVAREERSQHANKKLCVAKLAAHFMEHQTQVRAQSKTQMWESHKSLERGNEVRVYEGSKFKLRK